MRVHTTRGTRPSARGVYEATHDTKTNARPRGGGNNAAGPKSYPRGRLVFGGTGQGREYPASW